MFFVFVHYNVVHYIHWMMKSNNNLWPILCELIQAWSQTSAHTISTVLYPQYLGGLEQQMIRHINVHCPPSYHCWSVFSIYCKPKHLLIIFKLFISASVISFWKLFWSASEVNTLKLVFHTLLCPFIVLIVTHHRNSLRNSIATVSYSPSLSSNPQLSKTWPCYLIFTLTY